MTARPRLLLASFLVLAYTLRERARSHPPRSSHAELAWPFAVMGVAATLGERGTPERRVAAALAAWGAALAEAAAAALGAAGPALAAATLGGARPSAPGAGTAAAATGTGARLAAAARAREDVARAALSAVAWAGLVEWAAAFVQRWYPDVLALPDAFGKSARTGRMRWRTPFNLVEEAYWREKLGELVRRGMPGPGGAHGAARVPFHRSDVVSRGELGAVWLGCWPFGGARDLPGGADHEAGAGGGAGAGAGADADADAPSGVDVVVDLTNEVPEDASVVKGRRYVNFPVWDQNVPKHKEAYIRMVRAVASQRGNVLVHCIAGVGRSSMTAALIMLARGDVDGVDEAYARIRAARPIVRWRDDQRAFVEEMAARVAPGLVVKPAPGA